MAAATLGVQGPMSPFVAASGCWDLSLLPALYNWGISQEHVRSNEQMSRPGGTDLDLPVRPRPDDTSNDNLE